MPRAPAFKIDALADLLRQLEYAPPETRRRHMDAAERLAGEVEPGRAYPREFVTYRITGYRPDADELVTFAGGALRNDLCVLVQRLSDGLELPPARGGRAALPMPEVAVHLGVSSKSVQRYRRDGLVCHVVTDPDGGKRLACYADALERYMAARSQPLQRASRFTRIGRETEALIIDEARRLRDQRPVSLSRAARIIARRHGRAHETIRQLLRRHDHAAARGQKDSSRTIFEAERGPLSPHEIALAHRAWLRGVDLGPMSERLGRSRGAIVRAINRRRAELLRGLQIVSVALPTFALEGADAVILSAPSATGNLLALPPHEDALKLLDWAETADPPDELSEDALLAAWNLLKLRAWRAIAKLPTDESPTSEALDRIETDLRWAARLHVRLALMAFPTALRRIEANLGRSLIAHSSEQIAGMIRLASAVIREALEAVDPSRGQRVERIVSFAIERALAQRSQPIGAAPRAAARHTPGAAISLAGVFEALDEWEVWLDPWRRWRDHAASIAEPSRQMLILRFGWDGRPPLTLAAMAQQLKRGEPATSRAMQKAVRELRSAFRRAAAPTAP